MLIWIKKMLIFTTKPWWTSFWMVSLSLPNRCSIACNNNETFLCSFLCSS